MQRGNTSLLANAQMVVPESNFSCNGRVTGYLISLRMVSASGSYPTVQVWHATNPPLYTRADTECLLTATDISIMTDDMGNDYYLGNVSCTGSNRIEFQSGDIIGYHQGDPLSYEVWSSNNSIGYTTAIRLNEPTPLTTIDSIDGSANNMQPLIQILYGKMHTHAIYQISLKIYFD